MAAVSALSLVLIFFIFAPNARAQQPISTPPTSGGGPPTASAPLFKSGVDLVALNVVVTDAGGTCVIGLGVNDFVVHEDGVRQDISYFAAASVPVDLALLLDTSASMLDKIHTMQEAAIGFAATLRAGDRTTIVDMKDSVRILHRLDENIDGAKAAIRSTTAGGGTALFNGLYMTIKEMTKLQRNNGEVRRQAIVVLTDGDDTTSLVSFEDVMDVARQAGLAIYTITLRSAHLVTQGHMAGRRYFSQSEYGMKALAQESGGRSFFPAHIEELAGVYGSIADELANAYALGYTPTHARRDGSYRRITVTLSERPGLRARARNGYTAPRGERTTVGPTRPPRDDE